MCPAAPPSGLKAARASEDRHCGPNSSQPPSIFRFPPRMLAPVSCRRHNQAYGLTRHIQTGALDCGDEIPLEEAICLARKRSCGLSQSQTNVP